MRITLLIDVGGADGPSAGIGFNAMDIRIWTNLAAASTLRHSNGGSKRTGFGPHFAAEAETEDAIDASASPGTRLRQNRHGRRERMPAQLARGTLKNNAGRLYRQRRHGIRL